MTAIGQDRNGLKGGRGQNEHEFRAKNDMNEKDKKEMERTIQAEKEHEAIWVGQERRGTGQEIKKQENSCP